MFCRDKLPILTELFANVAKLFVNRGYKHCGRNGVIDFPIKSKSLSQDILMNLTNAKKRIKHEVVN